MKSESNYFKQLILLVCLFLTLTTVVSKAISFKSIKSINSLDSISTYKDLRYGAKDILSTDSSSDRILDLYLPRTNEKTKIPVFVFIHGGGFKNGDKGVEVIKKMCARLAYEGFAVLSINYRLTLRLKKYSDLGTSNFSKGLPANNKFKSGTEFAIANATEDCKLVLKWIKRNAVKYNFNTSSVAIGGSSAGAITALNLAYLSKQHIIHVSSVIDLWGGMANYTCINRKSPPVFICHGDSDKVVHVDFAYSLKEQMDKVGNKGSIIFIMKGKGHAQYDVILNEKMEDIISFLKSH